MARTPSSSLLPDISSVHNDHEIDMPFHLTLMLILLSSNPNLLQRSLEKNWLFRFRVT